MSVIRQTVLQPGITSVESPIRPLSVGLDPRGMMVVWYWGAEHAKERNSWQIELLGTHLVSDLERDEVGEFLGTLISGPYALHAFVR